MSPEPRAPAEIRTAILLTHTHPEQTSAVLPEALAAAETADCRLVAPKSEFEKHGSAAAGYEAEASLEGKPDLCLVLGGDGSILQALRRFAGSGVPVFGINYGTIGFLAVSEPAELDAALKRAFSGDFDVMPLPGLEIDLDLDRPVALNDISFTRRPHGRVAELSYTLGGEELGHVR